MRTGKWFFNNFFYFYSFIVLVGFSRNWLVKKQLVHYKINQMEHFLYVLVVQSKAILFYVLSTCNDSLFHVLISFFFIREGSKVSHYIINIVQENSKSIYKIGDKTFSNMKDLLNFYKQRLLDTSPLVRIVCFWLWFFLEEWLLFSIQNLVYERNLTLMEK